MNSIYNQSLNSIMFGKHVSEQNKAWLNRSGVSDEMNQQRANANYTLNAMAEQQSSTAWGKKTKNKDYLRLKIEYVDISKGSSKSE